MRRAVYVATGFLQNAGTATGLVGLWEELHARYSCAGTVVKLLPWNADWRAEANFVERVLEPTGTVDFVGYSWGAGWGFVRFATEARRRGRGIRRAFLLDPVYRHCYWLGQWRAFVPSIPVTIPDNVGRVTWWRQRIERPFGHDLRAASKSTILDDAVEVQAGHIYVDDLGSIRNSILSAFEEDFQSDDRQQR